MISLIMLFLRTNWRVILIVSIVGACLFKLNALVNERDDYKAKYIHMQTAFEVAAELRAKEIATLKASAQKQVNDISAKHQIDLNKILKGKANEKRTINALNVERNRLLHQLSSQASIRLPKDDTNQLASNNSDTTTAGYIKTLEQAGAVCAADYNYCKAYVDSQMIKLGVEND